MSLKSILRKASLIKGKTLRFRNADIGDALFIFSLRTDLEKSRYLTAVSGGVADQEEWLLRYGEANNPAYFIIEYNENPIGTVRLYDPRNNSFCWGSWILSANRPNHAAIESALMVYAYALDYLGFDSAHFDVRKENENVWRFHERFGAQLVAENELDFFYEINRESINISRNRYRRYLENTVSVFYL
jgi:RimJ/RimL family protein N-acetyltransferase